jgi:hypothetical protein
MVGRYEPDPLLAGSPCENFIRNCHNYGDITGSSDEAGGIIGYAEGSCIEELFIVDCSNSGVVVDNAYLAGGIIGHNGYIVRILNVYNTASVGARIGVGGIVGELSLSQDRVINAYSTGELIHEIDNYVCPRGAIVGYSSTNDQFSSCYWLASDEYGSNGQGPELEYSSAFYPTTSPSAWQLETPMHNTDDLLSALNAGVDDIESSFPQLGTVSRWHEDFGMENGGFPMFGIYDALNELPSALSVTVYPNPAKEKITMDGIHPAEVQVYNALGQVVKTVRDANEISVADLSQGVYLLRITDAEGRVYTNKMMIQ